MRAYNLASHGALAINSSGGQLLKWKDGNKFIKSSTIANNILGTEFLYNSYAEVIAYHIANWLGLKHLEYKLCKVIVDNSIETIACESEDFTHGKYRYLSIGKMLEEGMLGKLDCLGTSIYYWLISIIEQVVPDFKYYLDSMIVLDSIILNDDRHLGNFGLIQNLQNKSWGVPPIFDSGNSLFYHKDTRGIDYTSDIHTLVKCKPFSIFWDKQLNLVGNYRLNIPNNILARIHLLLEELVQAGLPEHRAIFAEKLLADRLDIVSSLLK